MIYEMGKYLYYLLWDLLLVHHRFPDHHHHHLLHHNRRYHRSHRNLQHSHSLICFVVLGVFFEAYIIFVHILFIMFYFCYYFFYWYQDIFILLLNEQRKKQKIKQIINNLCKLYVNSDYYTTHFSLSTLLVLHIVV